MHDLPVIKIFPDMIWYLTDFYLKPCICSHVCCSSWKGFCQNDHLCSSVPWLCHSFQKVCHGSRKKFWNHSCSYSKIDTILLKLVLCFPAFPRTCHLIMLAIHAIICLIFVNLIFQQDRDQQKRKISPFLEFRNVSGKIWSRTC